MSFVTGGAATALFENLAPGDPLQASGPFGRFSLLPGDHNRRYLLIATGTGVTPYRSMLPLLAQAIAERGIEVVLLQGARTHEELLYGDDFRAFADAHPAFRYVPCYSREASGRCPCRRAPWLRAATSGRIRPRCCRRYRLPVRQPEHGRRLLRIPQAGRACRARRFAARSTSAASSAFSAGLARGGDGCSVGLPSLLRVPSCLPLQVPSWSTSQLRSNRQRAPPVGMWCIPERT